MSQVEVKSFDKPDETRMFEGKGMADVVTLAGRSVARGQFEPGWRWSVNLRPIAKTELCEISVELFRDARIVSRHAMDPDESMRLLNQQIALVRPEETA